MDWIYFSRHAFRFLGGANSLRFFVKKYRHSPCLQSTLIQNTNETWNINRSHLIVMKYYDIQIINYYIEMIEYGIEMKRIQ